MNCDFCHRRRPWFCRNCLIDYVVLVVEAEVGAVTRRLWLGLLAAHFAGLAAIFGSDMLLQRPAVPPHLAALPAHDPFRLARDEGGAAGRGITILIRFRHLQPTKVGRST